MRLQQGLSEFFAEVKGQPKTKQLSFFEAVAMLVGTNIGIGILSIAHVAKNAGFVPLLFWLVVGGVLSTITMLYIAEAALRTKEHVQLTGLCVKYIGEFGKYCMFISVGVSAIGALMAYEKASGEILSQIFGIPALFGSILFFIPACGVLWLGLKAIGRGEKQVVMVMFLIFVTLIVLSFVKQEMNISHLFEIHWSLAGIIPIFNSVVFMYSAQYIVPEMARGLSWKPELLPKAVILGNVIVFGLAFFICFCAISVEGLAQVSSVVTLSWGKAIGEGAFLVANVFALLAILTSYWGLGGMFVNNIADLIKQDAQKEPRLRFVLVLFVSIPPLLAVIFGWIESIDEALYWPGVVGALVLSFFPILILQHARKQGEQIAKWQCSAWVFSWWMKACIVVVYLCATLLSIGAKYGLISIWLGMIG